MDDLIAWLRAQLDDDERVALACNRPYRHADEGATAPSMGVHWRWVRGENWETTAPDPVIDEFVAEPGQPCNLATVEEWPARGHQMPRAYAYEVVEMDAAAAGHIARHDPARVLAEVDAKRSIIERCEYELRTYIGASSQVALAYLVLKQIALPYAGQPGYREGWRP